VRAPEGQLTASTLVVYPTALKAAAALRDEARRTGPVVGRRVTTFPQLTDALARDVGAPSRVLEPAMAAVVLRRALESTSLPKALAVPRRGLVHELLATVDELKSAYLSPDDVRAIGESATGAAATALIGIDRLYAAYEASLRRLGAVDRHGREWVVSERLAAAAAAGTRPRTLAGISRIVFAEIYDFSVLQFLIATSLIAIVGDAELVAFAHGENVDATRFLDRTWNRFVGAEAIADQVLPAFVVRGGRTGSLAAALRGVFASERPAAVPGDGRIGLVVAPDRYREAEAVGRAIRERLRAGTAPRRIAVLARDMTVYGDLIEDVCRRFRIPVYFRKGQPLLANALVKSCLNVLACVAEGLPRARLEGVLDTDYLRAGSSRLIGTLRRLGFVSERARPLAECAAHRNRELPDALVSLVAVLKELDATRRVPAHVRAFTAVLRRLRLRVDLPGAPSPAAARRDALANERLIDTLSGLAEVTDALGVPAVPLREFLALLLAALEPQEIADTAGQTDSVYALSVLDARGLDFDVVYLLGLDDGTFPAPRSESPLLPDAVKREIGGLAAPLLRKKLGARAAGLPLGGLLRTAREASLEDPFLFFLALSMAEQELVLSYPAVDERGTPTVRSPFVDEVEACLDGGLPTIVLDAGRLVPEPAACCEPGELVLRMATDRWMRAPTATPDRLAAALRTALPSGTGRIAAIDRRALIEERRSRYFLTPPTDPRKPAWVDAYVGRLAADAPAIGATWSPSSLEQLGECGFKFFAARVLGLKERDDPEIETHAREQGTLFHHVLAEFLKAHPRLPADLDAARALGRTFVAAIQASAATSIAAKDASFLAITWTRLGAALDELIVIEHAEQIEREASGLGVERWLEWEFELALDHPSGAIPLHGKADRVEILRRGKKAETLRVVDYKVARSPKDFRARLDPKRDLGRTRFQIPVYLLGALDARLGDVGDDVTLEGGYLALLARAGEKRVMAEFEHAQLDVGPDAVSARIGTLVEHARAGRFDVDPSVCDRWCAYRGVCRYQPPPLEEDAPGDE
jgi:ATP-dependent helicase/DNAse subunit B